ncbi:hypothetical protein HDU76_013147 [Blyttiomyces sp. JEL0837]|nr:hypothetical protein HDU76_013147 [Blyttiomyces sp. JEL0837]
MSTTDDQSDQQQQQQSNATESLFLQFTNDLNQFVVGISSDPLATLQSMPHIAAILVLAPLVIMWIIRELTKPAPVALNLNQPMDDAEADEEEREEILKLAKTIETKNDAIWEIGVSGKSASVAEEGNLLGFEFSKSGNVPTVDEIAYTIVKAIARPADGQPPRRPQAAMFLTTRVISDDVAGQVSKKVNEWIGLRVETAENIAAELPAMLEKRKAVLAKSSPQTPPQPQQKIQMQPHPKRGCLVCRKEIEGKARQCSACKAIIYCSQECSQKDWPNHKIMCPIYKGNMLRLTAENLHDLPFTFYNKTKQLENFNQVAFLSEHNLHNVGVYRRLCQCFAQLQWGELSGELAAQCEANHKDDPEKQFELYGLPKELYPVGKPFKDDVNIDGITSWEAWYKAVGLPLSSPVALVYEVPLTLWWIIKNFAPVRTEGGRRQLTIHLLGPEREADLVHILPHLMSFLPKTDIVLHMVGPSISKRLRPEHLSYTFKNETSTMHISLRSEEYQALHYDGSLFGLDRKTRGSVPPDLVVILNAAVFQYPNYAPTIKMLIDKGQRTIFTEPIETSVEIMGKQIAPLGGALSAAVQVNPFRQPVFQWKKEVNLPGWSNGFMAGFGKMN